MKPRRADYPDVGSPTKALKPAGINAAVITAQVDELGSLERELAPVQLKLARVAALRTAIRAHFDASPPGEEFEARGDHFVVALGARALTRTINPAKLIKAIGLKMYASIARVTLGELERAVDPGVVAGVVTSAHTGARSLKVFERGTN